MEKLKQIITKTWNNRDLLQKKEALNAIEKTLSLLDSGQLRVAKPSGDEWIVNEWVKMAVVMYFIIREMELIEIGPFEFHDKIPLKKNYRNLNIRVVPHAVARYGAYIAPGVIMLPSYINIEIGRASCRERV